jgi:hypothetical protein
MVFCVLKVQRKQRKDMKPKRRGGERIIRRASSLRHSQRSVGRSGYAFAHQEGFAELITSGSIMTPLNGVVASTTASPANATSTSATPMPPYVDSSSVTASVNAPTHPNYIKHASYDTERSPVQV